MLGLLRKKTSDLEVLKAIDELMDGLGAELHDNLSQRLSAVRLLVDDAKRAALDPLELERILIRMSLQLDSALRDTRLLSHAFMSPREDCNSLSTFIETLQNMYLGSKSSSLHVEVVGMERRLESKVALQLFRMVQELVNNAIRHSLAWHVWIDVVWSSKKLVICVEDDGTSQAQSIIVRLRNTRTTISRRARSIKSKVSYHQGKRGLMVRIECLYDSISV